MHTTYTYGLHAHSQAAPYPYRVVAIGDTGWRVDGPDYQSSLYSTSREAFAFAHAMHRHLRSAGLWYRVVPFEDDYGIEEEGRVICGPMPQRAAEDTIAELPRVRRKIDDRGNLNMARAEATIKARNRGMRYAVVGFPPIAVPEGDPRWTGFTQGIATPEQPLGPITHAIG